jgi:hypothetical protein
VHGGISIVFATSGILQQSSAELVPLAGHTNGNAAMDLRRI